MRQSSLCKRIRAKIGAGLRGESGVSAIEFALLAPILIFAFLATCDLGLAAYERMTIDHILRAGAQSAMADPGDLDVAKVLEATAETNFTLAGRTSEGSGRQPLTVSVNRFCACPDDKGVAVDCSSTCPGSTGTFAYYRLSAAKIYSGMVIPQLNFDLSVEVQVR